MNPVIANPPTTQQPKQFRSLSATFAELEAGRKAIRNYPQMGSVLAISYVAFTTIILTYSFFISLSPILIFYALWLPQIFIKGTQIVRPSRDLVYCMLLPGLGLLSTLWSDYKGITLYHAAEFISMVLCVIIISRITSTKDFLKGIVLGTTVVLTGIVLNGDYALLGSKNQTGYIAEIGVITSLIILFSHMRIITRVAFGLVPFVFCLLIMVKSHSASSDMSLLATMGAVFVVYIINWFPKRSRTLIFISFLSVTCVMTVISLNLGLEDKVFQEFGKDSSLTGRTYLWQQGKMIGLRSPFIGLGYTAFWVVGRPEAEEYWYKFDIPGKSGFHFHSTYVESFVELGVVGLALTAALILMSMLSSFRPLLHEEINMEFMFAFALSFMFLIRAFVEVDIWGPFNIGPLLFFSIIPRLAKYRREQRIAALQDSPATKD